MKTTKTYENILCVIPARAGSQGIIDKNLQLIWGVPLVEHSIVHALDAGLDPGNIYVSSDGDEILHIARRNKVVAHKRPEALSGPASSTEETLLWVYDHHLAAGKDCDYILLLQPTSPIRFKGTVNRFLDFCIDKAYDSALTTTKFYDFFWQEGLHIPGLSRTFPKSSYNPANRPMRQELKQEDYRHFDNGNMYMTGSRILKTKKCRLGPNVGIFPISELEGMQIDTPEDLEIFRAVFSGEIPKKVGLE